MKPEKYVVLRTPSVALEEFGPAALGAPAEVADQEVRVETAELSSDEANDLRRDSSVRSFAQSVPLILHKPFDSDVVEAAEVPATWGVQAVAADTSPFDGAGITVAILDTGIEAGHKAFTGVNLIQRDFTGEGDGDVNGHGTHCAGTVFGRETNGVRIGVAPGVQRALIGKVLGGAGGGSTEGIAAAIQWALQEGANVISMSLGIDFPGIVRRLTDQGLEVEPATSLALEAYRSNVDLFRTLADLALVQRANSNATLIVGASGNESNRPQFEIAVAPPAAARGIHAVGALGKSINGLVVAPFSNTKVEVAAPGVGILSAALGGGTRSLSGTSMATPHVAGLAALWAEKLKQDFGVATTSALVARLVGSSITSSLAPGFDASAIGLGIPQAPQA